jgi:hypothetical protein
VRIVDCEFTLWILDSELSILDCRLSQSAAAPKQPRQHIDNPQSDNRSASRNPQAAIHNQPIRNLQSGISQSTISQSTISQSTISQSTISQSATGQSTIRNPQSANPQPAFCNLQLKSS